MLLRRLIERQKELGLSDREFSKLLSISRPVWYKTRTGTRKVGLRLVAGTVKRFPDLIPDVILFFQQYDSN